MSKNGGKPRDIPTLEEALRKFARERGLGPKNAPSSNVHYADFAIRRDELKTNDASDLTPPPVLTDEFDFESLGLGGQDQIVPIIDGIPRTLHELERIAAGEALRKDHPEHAVSTADSAED